MRRVAFLLAVVLAMVCGGNAGAKDKQESYNMSRAIEMFNAEDNAAGVEYLKRELADNPKNGVAYSLLAYYALLDGENGNALTFADRALKYLPKKDKTQRAYAHYLRGQVYLALTDTVTAIADIQQSVMIKPDDTDYPEHLADLYFDMGRYDDAEAIYRSMSEQYPGMVLPIYGMVRNAYSQNQFDRARTLLAKARLLSPGDEMSDRLEMRINVLTKDFKGAIDKAASILSNGFSDEEAWRVLYTMSDSTYSVTINAVAKKALEDKENSDRWKMLKGYFEYNHKEYEPAVKTFQSLVDAGSELKAMALLALIDTYYHMDDMAKVEETGLLYLQLYPDDADVGDVAVKLADARFFAGKYKEAAEGYSSAKEIDPGYASYCEYKLGWCEEMNHNYKAALEHYDRGILLDEDYAYTYMVKGFLLKNHLDRPEEAAEAFNMCIAKDSIAENGCCLQYAYIGLGQRDKAVEVMDSIIALNPDNAGTYYDAACVYSRLKEKDSALKYLRMAFEKGYKKFRHVENDADMDFIRDTPEFKALLEEFDKPARDFDLGTDSLEIVASKTVTHEIPLTRQSGGTYLVKASVNGLPMDFILDTGCSDVSISKVESDFMLKNGYLAERDLRGEQRYTDANGNVNTSQAVNLATVKLGEFEVKNIRAGIVPNQQAPLLLGQGVLSKFGKVEIDTVRNILKITVNK